METLVNKKKEEIRKCLKENGFTEVEVTGYLKTLEGKLPKRAKARILVRTPKHTIEQKAR